MPGKYERATDAARAEELHAESLDGTDEELSVGSSWHGLMGRVVMHEDDQGFFTYDEFDTPEDARREFEALR